MTLQYFIMFVFNPPWHSQFFTLALKTWQRFSNFIYYHLSYTKNIHCGWVYIICFEKSRRYVFNEGSRTLTLILRLKLVGRKAVYLTYKQLTVRCLLIATTFCRNRWCKLIRMISIQKFFFLKYAKHIFPVRIWRKILWISSLKNNTA